MHCNYCGTNNQDNAAFCVNCGSPLGMAPAGVPASYPVSPKQPTIPPEYRPISAWGYFGYNLLFSIPLVGFILLIVFSCGGTSNVNLKNYARSFWCGLVIALVLILTFVLMGGTAAALF